MILVSAALVATILPSFVLLPGIVVDTSAAAESSAASASDLHSDFNGDGYDDLAIGAPFEDIGAISDAGAVNVIYGSNSGLQTSSPADQFWHLNNDGVAADAAEQSDGFGNALAAGDFNGDGYGDIAIGVYTEDFSFEKQSAGAVVILHGSSGGLQTSSPPSQFWHQDSPGVEDTSELVDLFGSTLAAGDFNGDGYSDLAIGVPNETIVSAEKDGAVNVLYGSSLGLQTSSPADQFWHQNSPGVEDTSEFGDQFGLDLAAGDFNNDGFGDLAIGVPREDIVTGGGQNRFDAGAVNVLYGSSAGLRTTSPADQFWHQNSPGVEDFVEFYNEFGNSLAAGDFNNDGFGDLAIGVHLEDAVHVLYGSSSGLRTTSPADQFWTQDSPGVEDSPDIEFLDRFGTAVVAGDFNNDGFDDLAIGVSNEDIGSVSQAGAVNVLYGSASGLQTTSPADQFWHQNSPGVEDSAEQDDVLGWSLATGDFNNDGKDDLVIRVDGEDIGTAYDAAAVHVLYGSSARLQTSSPADQFWHQNSPGVNDSAEAFDHFGYL